MKILKLTKSSYLALDGGRLHAAGAEFYASVPVGHSGRGVLPAAQFFVAEEAYGMGALTVNVDGVLLRKGKGRVSVPFLDDVQPRIYSMPSDGEALTVDFETLKVLAELGHESSERPEFRSVIGGAPGAAVVFANGAGGAMMTTPVLGEDPLLLPVTAARALLSLGKPESLVRDGPYIWAEFEDGGRLRVSSYVIEEKMHSRVFEVLAQPKEADWWSVPEEWREAVGRLVKTRQERVIVAPQVITALDTSMAVREEVETPVEDPLSMDIATLKKVLPLAKEFAWNSDDRRIFWRGDNIHGAMARLVSEG